MSVSNNKVNLLIIGSQKAGTTSLFEYIKQHPEIYFSEVKEVTYFVNESLYMRGESYYDSFFYKYNDEKIKASAYVHMLPCKESPQRVKEYNANMKFIVMLREPKSRAFSAYKYAIKNGWENAEISYQNSFDMESERLNIIPTNYDQLYFYNGLYGKHLQSWFQLFDPNQFLIIKDNELRRDPKDVLKKIFVFLNINTDVEIDTNKKFNEAGTLRIPWLQKLLVTRNKNLRNAIGTLLNQKTKVFIMSKIYPAITSFNFKKESLKTNEISDKKIEINEERLNQYYIQDLALLKEVTGISF